MLALLLKITRLTYCQNLRHFLADHTKGFAYSKMSVVCNICSVAKQYGIEKLSDSLK